MSGYVIIFEITKMDQQYIKNSARKNNIEQTEAIPFIEWVSIYLHRYLKSIHKMPMKSFEFKSYEKESTLFGSRAYHLYKILANITVS